jgi:ATP/maltotriose-dependent transcriptional regulator MalT
MHLARGYGCRSACLPAAWLSQDENDSHLNLFLRYFIAALRTIFNEACEETLTLLQARQQPPAAILYATLSNELDGLPGEAILVLDDYPLLEHSASGRWCF